MRLTRLRLFTLFALLAAPGCTPAPDAEAARLTNVRVVFRKHLSWGPIYIAQAEGFFKDEGLDIEPVMLQRPQESLVALIGGDIDVMPGPLQAGFLSAIARRAPIRMVAGMNNLAPGGCTYFGIILRPGLDTAGGPPRLRRMRAGQDGGSRFLVDKMLERQRVSIKDIETLHLPDAVMATAMESGSIDAVAMSEPGLTRLKTIGTMWLSAQDAVPGFQWAVVAFGDRLLNRERETGMRFMRAYQRGVAQYRQGKTDRNVAIIAEATGETAELTREVCWPEFDADSRINWQSIAAYQAWANAEGHMLKTLSREEAFDSAFVASTARAPE
jgi:NitT/TauT family transport system substrate-binding protein